MRAPRAGATARDGFEVSSTLQLQQEGPRARSRNLVRRSVYNLRRMDRAAGWQENQPEDPWARTVAAPIARSCKGKKGEVGSPCQTGTRCRPLLLTALLLPAFGHLYLRTRDTRNLLWFLAFFSVCCACACFPQGAWADVGQQNSVDGRCGKPAHLASASASFLASLSPLRFPHRATPNSLCHPVHLPLVVSILAAVYPHAAPHGIMYWVLPALAFISFSWGSAGAIRKGSLPGSVAAALALFFGGLALWFYFWTGPFWPLVLAESGNHSSPRCW